MNHLSNKWLQHAILLTAPLLTVIDVFIVNIAIPSIKQGLHATDSQVELVIAAYLLGYASFQITGSRAGDLFGRKKIFAGGMFLFVITSCVCGLSVNANMLIIARFFQGISGAFMTPQTLAYVQLLFPEPGERTKAIGYVGITLGMASVLGQILGGYFSGIHTFIDGWRFIFFINFPIGMTALWASGKFLIDTRLNRSVRFDYSGVVLLTVSLGSLIYALTEGRQSHWSIWYMILVIAALGLFYIFILQQKKLLRQDKNPLIDVKLFKIKDFNIGLLLVSFYFMMHTSYLLVSTIYLQNGLYMPALETGIYFVWFGILFTTSSFLSIHLVNTFGKKSVQFGVLLLIACYLMQLNMFDNHPDKILIILLLSLTGLGAGLVLPSLINLTLKNVPAHFVGIASGMYNTAQQAASSVGICIIGGLFFSVEEIKGDIFVAFHDAIYAEIVCLTIVFVLLIIIKDIGRKKNVPDEEVQAANAIIEI